MSEGYVLSLDMIDDKLNSAFVGEDLQAVGFLQTPLEDFVASDDPINKFISFLRMRQQTSPAKLKAVALALSADITWDCRTVQNCSYASWLNGQNLAEIIEQEMDAQLFMNHRAATLLQYDRVFLNLPDDSTVVGFYIGDYYEFAAFTGGRILRGKHGAAGQLGHIPIPGREDICRCGKAGCVELYSSGYRLKQLQSLVFPDTPFEKIFTDNREHPLLLDFIQMLAVPVCIGINLFDPDYIVMGGRIIELPDYPKAETETVVRHMVHYPYPGDNSPFLYPVGGDLAGILAAAYHAHIKLM